MKKISLICILICFAAALSAQNKTSYFVENSTLRHKLNAAFAPDQGYIAIPVLSDINVGVYSNLGVSSFYFPLENNKLGLFLNENVSSEKFLSGLAEKSFMNARVSLDIMNAGWYTGMDSFWTIDLGVKTDIVSNMPKEFFRFMKEGMASDPQNYTIRDFALGGNVYSHVSVGYSRGLDEFVKGLRVGAKARLLFGMMDMSMKVDQLDIEMGSSAWKTRSLGTGYVYGGGLDFVYDENGNVSNMKFDSSTLGLSGVGASFDLGVEYTISEGTPVDGLRFSLSVADLGFISYFKNKSVAVAADGEANFKGFEGIKPGMDLNEQLDKIQDELVSMASFKEVPVEKSPVNMLSTKLYFGIDYTFFKDQMNVGLLYSGRYSKIINEHELTLSYNYTPVRWFDVAVSYSMMNTRSTFGWLLTFVPRAGLNVFLGSDYTSLKYTPQGVPVNRAFANFNLGISVPLGRNVPKR